MLERDKRSLRRQVKLLLLGAGESGKSTFLKQMKIIHGVRFEVETVREFQAVIYQNMIKGMRVLVDARSKLDIPWADPTNEQNGQVVLQFDGSIQLDTRAFLDICKHLRSLWEDASIRKAFDRRNEFQMSDSVGYFMSNMDRIANKDWFPTNQDILHARKATKGITEFTIPVQGVPFRFVDVGGQRSQRQKWFQCFEGVTSVLFLLASSEFDQVLLEDRQTRRLDESLNIFDVIVNNRFFRQVSLILFLNKTDLLAQKVASADNNITWFFPEFRGDSHSLADVQTFILNMFLAVRRDERKPVFHHFTTAVDTDNITVVFNAVKTTILQRNLETLMLQ